MKNVVAYIRVSTDSQAGEDKYGLEAQKEDIARYCKSHDMTILKWYADEGESGAKLRPGFDSIVYSTEVSNPPYEAVVVAKSDRVARDIEIYYYYKMLLRMKEITLISVSEDFGNMGVFAPMLESFTLCCAQMERMNITKRTSSGRAVKASKGGYSGGHPPFGYKVIDGNLEIVPELADVVRTIFRMDDEGKTLQAICDWLNDTGIPTRTGSIWRPSSMKIVLENRKTYEGFYRYGKSQEWVRGQHEAILKQT